MRPQTNRKLSPSSWLRRLPRMVILTSVLGVCVLAWAGQKAPTGKTPALRLLTLVELHPTKTEVSLVFTLKNEGTEPVNFCGSRPWHNLRQGNLVLCRKGVVDPARFFVPLCQGSGGLEQELRPNDSWAGSVRMSSLREGRYDLVGLLFAEIENAEGKCERVPLPIEHHSFVMPWRDNP